MAALQLSTFSQSLHVVAFFSLGGRSLARGVGAGQRSRTGTPVRWRRLVGELQREQLLRGDGHQRGDRPHGQEAHLQGRSVDVFSARPGKRRVQGSPAFHRLSAASRLPRRATRWPRSSEITRFPKDLKTNNRHLPQKAYVNLLNKFFFALLFKYIRLIYLMFAVSVFSVRSY